MKLNAEQIKKALECCTGDDDCNRCPYWEGADVNCFDNVKSDALTLITSQEQRIKELEKIAEFYRREAEKLAKIVYKEEKLMEYKINKESVDKVSKLKIDPTRYVEITEDMLEASKTSLEDLIWEAHKTALHNGIRANTVMINKRLAKTSAFVQSFSGGFMDIPPMICGLEAYVTDEIPNEFAFCVAEAPETKRERIRAAERRLGYEQGVKAMQERLKDGINEEEYTHNTGYLIWLIDQIAKEMLEGKDEIRD